MPTTRIIVFPRRGAFLAADLRETRRRDVQEIRRIVADMRAERGTDSWSFAVEELQDAVFDVQRSRFYQRLAIRILTRLRPEPGELRKVRQWSQEDEDEIDHAFAG